MSAALRVEAERRRSGRIVLDRHGRHFVHLDLGHVSGAFDRKRGGALLEALTATEPETALVLLSAFAPGVRGIDDVAALQRALIEFEEELAFEDRRGSDRAHNAVKRIVGL